MGQKKKLFYCPNSLPQVNPTSRTKCGQNWGVLGAKHSWQFLQESSFSRTWKQCKDTRGSTIMRWTEILSIIDQYNLKYLQVNGNTYNVPFYNEKQEGLHNQKKLTVVKLRGKLQIFCQWILNVFQWWDLLSVDVWQKLKDLTHCYIICVNKWPKFALTCLCVDAPLSTILIVDLFLSNHPSDHPW